MHQSNNAQSRSAWTEQEDDMLRAAVAKYGDRAWATVAIEVPGRSSKSCSDRWRNFLSPEIEHPRKSPFSEWEVAVVVQAQHRYGNNWKAISMLLPGRTNRAVKNLFVGNLKWGARLPEIQNRYLETRTPLEDLLEVTPDYPGGPPKERPGLVALHASAGAAHRQQQQQQQQHHHHPQQQQHHHHHQHYRAVNGPASPAAGAAPSTSSAGSAWASETTEQALGLPHGGAVPSALLGRRAREATEDGTAAALTPKAMDKRRRAGGLGDSSPQQQQQQQLQLQQPHGSSDTGAGPIGAFGIPLLGAPGMAELGAAAGMPQALFGVPPGLALAGLPLLQALPLAQPPQMQPQTQALSQPQQQQKQHLAPHHHLACVPVGSPAAGHSDLVSPASAATTVTAAALPGALPPPPLLLAGPNASHDSAALASIMDSLLDGDDDDDTVADGLLARGLLGSPTASPVLMLPRSTGGGAALDALVHHPHGHNAHHRAVAIKFEPQLPQPLPHQQPQQQQPQQQQPGGSMRALCSALQAENEALMRRVASLQERLAVDGGAGAAGGGAAAAARWAAAV